MLCICTHVWVLVCVYVLHACAGVLCVCCLHMHVCRCLGSVLGTTTSFPALPQFCALVPTPRGLQWRLGGHWPLRMRRSGLSTLPSDRLWVVVSLSFIGTEGHPAARSRLRGVSLANGGTGWGCRGPAGALRRADMWPFRPATLTGLKGRGVCVCIVCSVLCVCVVCTCASRALACLPRPSFDSTHRADDSVA